MQQSDGGGLARFKDLCEAGGTLLRARDDGEIFWDVLADPEGNEFCVFAPEGEAG